MKKIILIAASLVSFGFAANAQVDAAANQNVVLTLSDAIAITFTANDAATGPDVPLTFSTVAHYQNGVESDPNQLKVQSNKPCRVEVKAGAANFTYSGSNTPDPMAVEDVLSVKVTGNTSGTIENGFSAFTAITTSNVEMLSGIDNGGNETFNVTYLADPGFNFPSGTYTANIVYTATQE